jgi:STE24 endopeptidase
VQFVLYVSVVSFPLTVYSGLYREHQYGLATQTFWPWMTEQLIGLAVTLVLGGLGMVVPYAVLRRVGRDEMLHRISPGTRTVVLASSHIKRDRCACRDVWMLT